MVGRTESYQRRQYEERAHSERIQIAPTLRLDVRLRSFMSVYGLAQVFIDAEGIR